MQSTPVEVAFSLEIGGVTQNVLVEATAPADQLQLEAAATGGTRLDIPVRELPATLTIVTQDLIQERGVTSAMDATELAPGITTFVDSASIPGINARVFSSTSGAVSVTRDGIRQNTVAEAGRPLDTFMLERVEILLLRYSGLRISDAAVLERVRLSGDKLFLYTQKTRTPVWVPLPQRVVDALKASPSDTPVD